MSIRFHLPALAIERLSFAYSPLVEAVLSLHVLVEPKHHPLQHEFVRRMRALSTSLRRRIAEFAFVYRWTMPDFVAPPADEAYGNSTAFRAGLREHEIGYVLAVSCSHLVPLDGGKTRVRADRIADRVVGKRR